ncbi:hypothetical protein [Verrucomicrobium sp. 3C]|uniref:hypothetical protein n=1 Tax=Verrucomicrobium sp. 3C TaxID=1134055 RepID=UPI00037BB379|nr:hypothetical protein [Verrucomicrobium sp. 3C]
MLYGFCFAGCRSGFPPWLLRVAGWKIWFHHWDPKRRILLRLSVLMIASILIGVALVGPTNGPTVGAYLLAVPVCLNVILCIVERLADNLARQRSKRWWEANQAIQRTSGRYTWMMNIRAWPHAIRDNRLAATLTGLTVLLGIAAEFLPFYLEGIAIAYFVIGTWSLFFLESQRIASAKPQI